LNLLIRGGQASFPGILVYNKDYYKDSFISGFIRHYQVLLESILKEPDQLVSQLNMLSPDERHRLLVEWNQTCAHYPENKTIHQLFAEQVQRTPDNIALLGPPQMKYMTYMTYISYKELNEKSNQLARILGEKGVKPDTIAAIMVERSIEMIIGLLGILKAGGAYLPIDMDYPQERIDYILKDSGAEILLTKQEISGLFSPQAFNNRPKGTNSINNYQLEQTSLAYVIYTSGTTGRPKGCLVTHRNLVRLFKTDRFPFQLHQHETWVMAHSFCFDFSVWEMYGALLNGGRLIVPPPGQVRDINLFLLLIKRHQVTILNQTPQAFYVLVDAERKSQEHSLNHHLRTIIFGGDKLLSQNLSGWSDRYSPDHIQLVNMYGITETTVHVTYYRLKESDIRSLYGISSIGRPLPETTLYILDNLFNPVPMGISGEIFVGGTGVARGYLNRPELTCEKFKINQKFLRGGPGGAVFSKSAPPGRRRQKLYKTGDLGRRLPDGNVEYLGRNDDQVQIRGFRIEPAEIESHLLNHPAVKETVVLAREDKNLQAFLCAYIRLVPDQSLPPISHMREYLAKRLPHYMVPSYFVSVNTIPLTPNGKVDKKALPDPQVSQEKPNRVPPRTPMEKTLAEIWAEVLEMKTGAISIDDDFFDSGGHSLKATVLIAKIHQKFNVKIPMVVLFQAPQIKKLAGYITHQEQEYYYAVEPAEEKEYYALSPTQKRLYVLHQLIPNSTGYNVTYVIHPEGHVDKEKLETIFKRLIARHESLRTSFQIVSNNPVQKIHEEVEFKIECDDISKVEEEGQMTEERAGTNLSSSDVIRHLSSEFIRPFDLHKAPLLRVNLVNIGSGRQILIIDMHHIITDATSLNILEREFETLYEDPGKEPPPLRLQYKDFSEWMNDERQKTLKKQQESYWLEEFSDELPVLNLPTDYPRPLMQSFAGNRVNFAFNPQETQIIKEIAGDNGVTLFMCLLAVFNILFSKLSGQEDIIWGTPIAARRHADLQHIIGMLVNTLPLRNYPSANKTFLEFLQEVKQRTLEAYENQEYPFEDLVDHLSINRDTSRNPVFDVMLNLLNQPDKTKKDEMTEVPSQPPYEHRKATSRFDLVFSAMESGEHIYFFIEYSTRLFLPNTVERFITYLKNIVHDLPKHTESRLSDIRILSEEEKCKLLGISVGVEELYDNAQTIPGMFEEQVEKTPDRVALMGLGMEHMSYRKLNQESNRLAFFLKGRGVGGDTVVGLMKERSIEMIIGILAILKAGGAYLPIDPRYPQQRIETMLNDSGAIVLLTESKELASFSITGLKNMKARNKHIVVTPARDQITNFDRLPIPDRTLIDYKKYHQYIGEAPSKHTITLQATRGCPYHCLYCHKIWPKKHVTRSAENIFKEISYAYEAGIRRFVFIDDIFNLDQKNAARFLETIIKSKMDIQLFFPNGFRADILDRDFIDLMAAAGTVNLAAALESASPRIQKLIRKNLNLEKFKENVQYITETYPGIILEMEMMLGFPTESQEEALMTLDFLESLEWVHFPNLHILKIFPNTDICKLAIENGISKETIERSADLAFHELPDTLPFSKSFTRQFQAKFMGEYFLSKKRLRHVLPFQMKILTEDELIQKYDSYLSSEIKHFDDILHYAGISGEELGNGDVQLMQEEQYQAPDFVQKISKYFPVKTKTPPESAFRILLLDLSQLFSEEHEYMMHHQIEEPLGLLYLMTYLNETFKDRIHGKIFKSRIDFDSYHELKTIIFDFRPDLIGIRTLSFYKEFFHKAVLMIRQWGVDVPIAAGGPYATSDYNLILQDTYVDIVVLGEGELTLAHLVEKMMQNNHRLPGEEELQDIRGIAFCPGTNQRDRDILLLDEISEKLGRYPTENLEFINRDDDLLYLIYTSGSTGTPKGVILEHGNLVNLIRYQYNHTNIDFSRVLQFTTIGFDVSAQEIFSTLLAGGVLFLVSREMLSDIPELFKKVKNDHIKTLFLPTSFLKFAMNEEDFLRLIPTNVDHIVTAGEQAIVNQDFKRYLKENHVYFHNHYGPSETHVVTALCMEPGEDVKELPPIGRPVLNTSIYLLDKGNHPVPVGIPGELFIGGLQVGRGYLNNPELTAEKFDHDLWDYQDYHDGNHRSYRSYRSYIYRTGDLARWLPDGNIEFLGRMDHQVKIRGFRVELGEIESKLLNHPGIKEAVVQARTSDTNERYLCAYIAAKNDCEPNISAFREYLSRELPEYMIPAYFVLLDELPLTPNRKIDRRRLPGPDLKAADTPIAPGDEIHIKLAGIWAEVLGINRDIISMDSNFFELGGHSLKATFLASKINKEFGVKLPLAEIFKTPTIKDISQYIQHAVTDRYASIEPVEKKEYYGLSSAQQRLYILYQMTRQSIVYNMPEVVPLAGTPSIDQLKRTFNQLLARHESLRTSFHLVKEEPVQRVHNEVEFEIEYDQSLVIGHWSLGNCQGRGEVSSPIKVEKIIRNFIRPFDLSKAPLLRVGLIKPSHTPSALRGHPSQEGRENKCLLIVDMHHIISDGVSHGILVSDFLALDRGLPLPELRIHYKDFAAWQNHPDIRKTIQAQETYWLEQFKGEIPVLNLPTDYVRPAVQSFEGRVLEFELPDQYTRALAAIASGEGVTLYMVLLAVVNIFFSKLSSQEDIVIGSPIAGRRHENLNKIIGMFVNTLALRNYPNGEKSFREFLQEVKERTLQAFENQEYPFEDLVDRAAPNRDISRNPLFDVTFGLQNQNFVNDRTGSDKAGTEMRKRAYFQNTTAKFDLTLIAVESGKQLKFAFQYTTRLFKKKTIERFINYYKKIVSSILHNRNIKIAEIDIISEAEKKRLLFEFNDTQREYPADKAVHKLFEEQAGKTPGHIALLGVGTRFIASDLRKQAIHVTYHELNQQSNQLTWLLKQKGVKPNTIAGIIMERCVDLLVGILGILKAGGAYLPIDHNYPEKRIQYMLDDSGVELVVVGGEYKGKLKIHQLIDITDEKIYKPSDRSCTGERSLEHVIPGGSLLYLIYTSGSTGRPKGVPVIHRGLVNLVYSHRNIFEEQPGDRISQVASPGFDAMASEIWPCLLNGGTLIIADDETRSDAETMKKWLMKHRITISFQSTMIAEQLLNQEWYQQQVALRVLRTAGEQLTRYPPSPLPFKFYNLYGPTEDTVWTTWAEIGVKVNIKEQQKPGPMYEKYPPIGQPIANHQVYILGAYGGLQPIGIEGELCIAGDGLALGYLNNPELTAEKFCLRRPGGRFLKKLPPWTRETSAKNFLLEVSDKDYMQSCNHASMQLASYHSPHPPITPIPHYPIYHTGDLARWLPDGNIEFLGRIDQQVKIRGFRIELGEIETSLVNHPAITGAVVIVKEIHREKYLCAYIVSSKKITISELREYLSRILPDYMIPSYFTFVEKIPLTPNGKVDGKALPTPEVKMEGEYLAPRNDTEEKLVQIWWEILGIEKDMISIDADFFQLGGHSLKATILASKIRTTLHAVVPVVEIFKNPTIQSLAEYIKNSDIKNIAATDHHLTLLKHEINSDKHLFLIHDGTGQVEGYIEFAQRLTIEFNCWGIRTPGLENNAPLNVSIQEIAKQYIKTMKRIQTRGPYFIAGWSLGGTIAFEMACQLEQEGESPAFLGLVDSPGPQPENREKTSDFSVESEVNWALEHLPDNETGKKLKNAGNINKAWSIITLHLEERHDGIELIKSLIPHQLARTIPDYHQQGIGQLISYLNQYRTLTNARAVYIPTKKIETTVHYFKASQSPVIFRDCWHDYCTKPINSHEIPGDHLSIFKTPRVDQTVTAFAEVLTNIRPLKKLT
jgi:amino acid adenylation domain-containing protein